MYVCLFVCMDVNMYGKPLAGPLDALLETKAERDAPQAGRYRKSTKHHCTALQPDNSTHCKAYPGRARMHCAPLHTTTTLSITPTLVTEERGTAHEAAAIMHAPKKHSAAQHCALSHMHCYNAVHHSMPAASPDGTAQHRHKADLPWASPRFEHKPKDSSQQTSATAESLRLACNAHSPDESAQLNADNHKAPAALRTLQNALRKADPLSPRWTATCTLHKHTEAPGQTFPALRDRLPQTP